MSGSVVSIVARSPALQRMLRILMNCAEPPFTRQLLSMLGEWDYGQKLIRKAERLGLIRREEEECKHIRYKKNEPPKICKYVYITELGRTVWKLLQASYVEEALAEVGKHIEPKDILGPLKDYGYKLVKVEGDYIYVRHPSGVVEKFHKSTWESFVLQAQGQGET